jgi:capsular polysaccharide biosynthesis protein
MRPSEGFDPAVSTVLGALPREEVRRTPPAQQAVRKAQTVRKYTANLLRWMWLIGLCTVLGGGLAFQVSRLQTPVYRATTLLIDDQQTTGVDAYSNLLARNQLVSTYLSLIKTPPVMQQAASSAGGLSASDLDAATRVSNPGVSTQIIQIQVDNTDAGLAAKLANAVATAFITVQRQTADAEFQTVDAQISQQISDATTQIKQLTAQLSAQQYKGANAPDVQQTKAELDARQDMRVNIDHVISVFVAWNGRMIRDAPAPRAPARAACPPISDGPG